MSYQSTETWNPSRNDGWRTKPTVVVSAFSGATSGLPPEKLVPDTVGGTGFDVSVTVKPPRVWSKRSRRFAARTSRERVARKRTWSFNDHDRPPFHAHTAPDPE